MSGMALDLARLRQIREQRPLIHCVTNFVSANDCADLALALGASPIMAVAEEEMEEITARSSASVLNTGTPTKERFHLCRLCGSLAASMGHPVVLDPVGVGASAWRLREIEALLGQDPPTILRANDAEALALLHGTGEERGVDSTAAVARTARPRTARSLARKLSTVVLLSGADDIISDGEKCLSVPGGSPRMTSVTGTGCMLSVLCGIFAAVEPDPFSAAAMAAVFWKRCAEIAEERAGRMGPGSFRAALLDAAGQDPRSFA